MVRLVVAMLMVATVVGTAQARHRPHRHGRHRHHAAGPHVAGLHPLARARLAAALGDMRRHGVSPHLTSAYRSTAQQGQLFRCARSRRCRTARGIYGARRPGTSAHEAGLAVDIAGMVARSRGHRRRLTGRGVQIVRIMRRHEFDWRYGLRDPAHFELSPRDVGYRSTHAAIVGRQRQLATHRLARHRSVGRVIVLRNVAPGPFARRGR